MDFASLVVASVGVSVAICGSVYLAGRIFTAEARGRAVLWVLAAFAFDAIVVSITMYALILMAGGEANGL